MWQQMPAISQDQRESMSPGYTNEINVDFISICIPHTLLPSPLPKPPSVFPSKPLLCSVEMIIVNLFCFSGSYANPELVLPGV